MSAELLKQVKSLSGSVAEVNKSLEERKAKDEVIEKGLADVAEIKKAWEKLPVVNAEGRLAAQAIDHKEEGKYGYKSLGHFAHLVKQASGNQGLPAVRQGLMEQLDKGIARTKSLYGMVEKTIQGNDESVDSEGGFLVPPAFSQTIFERVYQNDIVSRCDQYTVTGRTMAFPANAETSRVDGSRYGGVLAYWTDEGTAVTATKPTFRRLMLTLRKLFVYGAITSELLDDSPTTMDAYLTKAFAGETAFQTGAAIFRGTGVGQPRGIISHPCVVSVSKETGQAAASIVPQNIWKMYARMWAPSLTTAAWFINQDVWPALFGLKFDIGTAGVPVYLPPAGISGAPYGTILGRPVIPTEFCSTLGTVGDIIFADLSQYIVINKGQPNSAMSMHLFFDSDQMAYRSIFRIDGDCWWNKPLTPYQGTNTQSPIITLATRS